MSRRTLALLVVLGAATLASADPTRGLYYRNDAHHFECWIPAGFKRNPLDEERATTDGTVVDFDGSLDATWWLVVATYRTTSLAEYAEGIEAEKLSGTFRFVDRFTAGGRPALTLMRVGLDRKEFEGGGLVEGAVDIGGTVVRFIAYVEEKKVDEALALVRGILATFRVSGARGLDLLLGTKRVDAAHRLAFRVPRDAISFDDAHRPEIVYAGFDATAGLRIVVGASEAKTIAAALDAEGKGDRAPAFRSDPGGFELVSELDPLVDGADARARVAARAEDGVVYVVEATGRTDGAAARRTAELVAMSLARVDVEEDLAAVTGAVLALKTALKADDRKGIEAALDALEPRTYLAESRAALRDALTDFESWRDIVRALDALAATNDAESGEVVLKLARDSRRHSPPELLVALLESLGQLRTPRAVATLLRHARDGSRHSRVAAVRALGFYRDDAKKIVTSFASLMRRGERDAEKGDASEKLDWAALRPAFQESLHRLTGVDLPDAAAASEWLKANRGR